MEYYICTFYALQSQLSPHTALSYPTQATKIVQFHRSTHYAVLQETRISNR